jgi:hypothetical protein
MTELALDWNTLDLRLPLQWENDPDRLVVQRMLVALRTLAGTWWLDGTFGLQLFELWLVKGPDLRLIEADLRRVLLRVPGVLRVVGVKLKFDAAARSLVVNAEVATERGVLSMRTVRASDVEVGDTLDPARFYLMFSGPGGALGLAAGLVVG